MDSSCDSVAYRSDFVTALFLSLVYIQTGPLDVCMYVCATLACFPSLLYAIGQLFAWERCCHGVWCMGDCWQTARINDNDVRKRKEQMTSLSGVGGALVCAAFNFRTMVLK